MKTDTDTPQEAIHKTPAVSGVGLDAAPCSAVVGNGGSAKLNAKILRANIGNALKWTTTQDYKMRGVILEVRQRYVKIQLEQYPIWTYVPDMKTSEIILPNVKLRQNPPTEQKS